ncbi:MAG TPA: DUF3987 domain-containing protein [Beijerinckiaceae bacterium]|jgi:hypothetical protein
MSEAILDAADHLLTGSAPALRLVDESFHDTWPEADLSLLGSGQRSAPRFPLSVLGSDWANWVEEQAAAASAPLDYVACTLLACAGAALGNVRWAHAGAAWSEPPLVWVGLVGSPSSGKSPAVNAGLRLVTAAEQHMAKDYAEVERDYALAKETAAALHANWQEAVKKAAKESEPPPPLPPAAVAPPCPVRPRIRVADVTSERLAALAAALPRGLLLVRDELSGWLGAFDRYSGGGADRPFALEMYGGNSYQVDRQKHAEPVVIPHLSVGLLGGVQPDKLVPLLRGPDDGLVARVLWAWPDSVPPFTLARGIINDRPMVDAFIRLASLPTVRNDDGKPEPVLLRLTPEAQNALEAFGREAQVIGEDQCGVYAGALGKARGHALRLACIVEHLWWCTDPCRPEPDRIDRPAMDAAVTLVQEYFLPMAERVCGDAATPAAERSARTLARRLRRERLASFNARELRRSVGAGLRNARDMDEACQALVEARLIRPAPTRKGDTPGRPTKTFVVNPTLLGSVRA